MRYELTDLRVFLAVADAQSLSKGAVRCHLSPSAVSLRIKALESALGVSLFERHVRGVSLTPAGSVLLEHARRCMAQLAQMQADLAPYAQGVGANLTLFANNNALSSHLPSDLARFFARYPAVRVRLEERSSHDIVNAVLAGRAHLGVVALGQRHEGLEYIPYRRDELVVLVPGAHALAGATHVRFADCLGEPFVSLQSGMALHTFLVDQAEQLGVRLDIRVQVAGYGAIAQLVASGAGVGIVPRSAVPQRQDARTCRVLRLEEPWAKRDLHLCCLAAVRAQPFVAALLQVLTEHI